MKQAWVRRVMAWFPVLVGAAVLWSQAATGFAAAQPQPPAEEQPAPPKQPAEPGKDDPAPATAADPEVRTFEAVNCRMRVMPKPWGVRPARPNQGTVQIAMVRLAPSVNLTLSAEDIGNVPEHTLDTCIDATRWMYSSGREVAEQSRKPETVSGVDGARVTFEVRADKKITRAIVWIGYHGGVMYRIYADGAVKDQAAISAALDQACAGFEIIDAKWRSSGRVGDLVTEHASPDMGAKFKPAPGSGWRTSKAAPSNWLGEVQFKRSITDIVAFNAFVLPDVPLESEVLLGSVLERLGVVYPSADATLVATDNSAGATTWTIHATKAAAGGTIPLACRLTRHGSLVTTSAAWSIAYDAGASKRVHAAIDAVTFVEPVQHPVLDADLRSKLTENQHAAHRLLHNHIGTAFHAKGRMGEALKWYLTAMEFNGADPTILGNALNAMLELKQFREGAALVAVNKDRYKIAQNPKRSLQAAHLCSGAGDKEAACVWFEAYFASGERDDEVLDEYVKLLRDRESYAEALKALDSYASGDAKRHTATRAWVLVELNRSDDAVAVLKPFAEGAKADRAMCVELVDVLNHLDRHTESLEVCEALLRSGQRAAGDYWRKARAERALGWHAKAKQSLQQAIALAPANARIKEDLEEVSALLGEGDNTAVRTAIEPVKFDDGLRSTPSAFGNPPSDLGYLWEVWIDAVDFVPGKVHKRTRLERARILDRRGCERLSSLVYSFHAPSERVYVNRLEVTDPQGVVTRVDPSSFFVTGRSDGQASSFKELNVPIPGLAPGSRLEIEVTTQSIEPGEALPLETAAFFDRVPVGRRALVINADPKLISLSVTGDVPTQRRAEGVTFVTENLLLHRAESMQPPVSRFLPSVYVSAAGSTWEHEAQDYYKLIEERLKAADSEDVRRLAARLVEGKKSAAAKLDALARHVQHEVTYKAIEFGRRAQIPDEPTTVLRNRYGDCKDMALLLHALLRAADIPSYLALVRSAGPLRTDVPDREQFNHAIVYVPLQQGDLFVDCTATYTDPVRACRLNLGGQDVLVIDPAKPRLVRIPEPRPEDNLVQINRAVTVSADGAMDVEETHTYTGTFAARWRYTAVNSTQTPLADQLTRRLSASGEVATVSACSLTGTDDVGEPMVVKVSYRLPQRLQSVGQSMHGRLLAQWESELCAIAPLANRTTPFEVDTPYRLVSTTRVRTGQGLRCQLPEVVDFSAEWPQGGGRVVVKADGADGLLIEASAEDRFGMAPAADFEKYTTGWANFLNTLGPSIEFRKQ